MTEWRVKPGDVFQLTYFAATAPTAIRAWIDVELDNKHGRMRSEVYLTTFTTDRTGQTANGPGQVQESGTIVGGGALLDGAIQRGQLLVYGRIRSTNSPGPDTPLFGGPMYSGKDQIGLGEFVEAGPYGGHGAIRTVTGANPAAGSDTVSEAVPTNVIWKLISFSAVLVTSADAATRTPNLIIDDGTTENRRNIWQGSTQIESLTRTHFWQSEYGGSGAQGAGNVSFTDTQTVLSREVLPLDLYLREAYRIRIVTTNFDSTAALLDDWAAPIFIVEEWLVP